MSMLPLLSMSNFLNAVHTISSSHQQSLCLRLTTEEYAGLEIYLLVQSSCQKLRVVDDFRAICVSLICSLDMPGPQIYLQICLLTAVEWVASPTSPNSCSMLPGVAMPAFQGYLAFR